MVKATSEFLSVNMERYPELLGRPFVTLSYAQSLDGSIAARRGIPLSLSGSESLILTHGLRAAHSAVLVGIGTVLADNPRLNVRLVSGRDPQPLILDSRLRFPLDSHMLNHGPLSPWIITTPCAEKQKQYALEKAGARVLRLPAETNGWVNLNAMLKSITAMGINSVMVEGGARVITSFLRCRLVDQMVLTITPTILGGLHAVEAPLFADKDDMIDVSPLPRIHNLRYEHLGSDIVVWGTLAPEAD